MSRRKIDAAAFAKPNFEVDVPRPPDRTEVGDEVISRWVDGMPADAAKVAPEEAVAEPAPAPPASKGRAPKSKPEKLAAAVQRPASRLRRDERGEKLTIWLTPELASELRVACAKDRVAQSIAVEEAVKLWLEKRG